MLCGVPLSARKWLFGLLFLAIFASFPLYAQHGDLGNGRYRNPILFADYSDPDIIQVHGDYYLVASSFHFMPGVPVLESHDLVNWRIIGHVFSRLDISPDYSMLGGTAYARGAWAPSIRYHHGLFYVYFPTPTEGIFMSTAKNPAGPWTRPIAVIAEKGLEDPCPFWDDDGKAYLVHSRTGAGPLILHRMSADGTRVLDAGKTIIDDPKRLPTLEGPKLYKRHGYYYIFAPYGGVGTGSQAVLRSKDIYGPYEIRTVLAQGNTNVNGPHQGGYVETPKGQGWFLHFQQRDGYGRIDYLEPVRWENDWPVIGEPIDGGTTGEPVLEWKKPDVGRVYPIEFPQTSDEFNSKELGLQWEWNHNPDDSLWSLNERPGYLRLRAGFASDLLHAHNTLTEAMQDPEFKATISLSLNRMEDGEQAGLCLFGIHASWIGIVQTGDTRRLVFSAGSEKIEGPILTKNDLQLQMHVAAGQVTYAYSLDHGKSFEPLGDSSPFYFNWWKAARPSIFNFNTNDTAPKPGMIDVDWFHYQPIPARLHQHATTGPARTSSKAYHASQ